MHFLDSGLCIVHCLSVSWSKLTLRNVISYLCYTQTYRFKQVQQENKVIPVNLLYLLWEANVESAVNCCFFLNLLSKITLSRCWSSSGFYNSAQWELFDSGGWGKYQNNVCFSFTAASSNEVSSCVALFKMHAVLYVLLLQVLLVSFCSILEEFMQLINSSFYLWIMEILNPLCQVR